MRRGGSLRENPGYGAELFPVGHELLSWAEVRRLRQNDRLPAEKCVVRDFAEAGGDGGAVEGKADGQSADGKIPGAGKPVLRLRRAGRKLREPDSGHHLCRGAAGRGGADAPQLRGAGLRPMLRRRESAVVQLQPRRAGALVLPDVDSGGGEAELSAAPLHHGGQSLPDARDPAAVPEAVHGGVLPAVYSRAVGAGGGAGLRLFLSGNGGEGAGRLRKVVCLLRLRDGESHVHGAVGAAGWGLVPGEGVLLQLPGGAAADDRRGIRPGAGGACRGTTDFGGDRGPLGGQLH